MSDVDEVIERLTGCTVQVFEAPDGEKGLRYPDQTASPGDIDVVLAELERLRAIAADLAREFENDPPHRQEYYSGGQYWHYCTALGCDGWPGYGENFGPRSLTTYGTLEAAEALQRITHGDGCLWLRAVEATT